MGCTVSARLYKRTERAPAVVQEAVPGFRMSLFECACLACSKSWDHSQHCIKQIGSSDLPSNLSSEEVERAGSELKVILCYIAFEVSLGKVQLCL